MKHECEWPNKLGTRTTITSEIVFENLRQTKHSLLKKSSYYTLLFRDYVNSDLYKKPFICSECKKEFNFENISLSTDLKIEMDTLM